MRQSSPHGFSGVLPLALALALVGCGDVAAGNADAANAVEDGTGVDASFGDTIGKDVNDVGVAVWDGAGTDASPGVADTDAVGDLDVPAADAVDVDGLLDSDVSTPQCLVLDCDDKIACTVDLCDDVSGCSHLPGPATLCDDGNPCTLTDTCGAGACAGTLDCACALAAAQTLATADNCATPFDDNCDGFINEAATCGATTYKFSVSPECSFYCYYDEAHSVATNGVSSSPAGFDTFATGQLFDGVKGVDDWAADTGLGPAFEWVGWSLGGPPVITVQFAMPRNVAFLRLGLNNFLNGDVVQPPRIDLRFSLDGQTWTMAQVFQTADGSEPVIPDGKRGDVTLAFPLATARYVEIAFVTPGKWTFVDELAFD